MKLYLEKISKGQTDIFDFEMENLVQVVGENSMLLVDKSELGFSNVKEGVNTKNDFYRIYKILFISKCDITIAKNILIAFYIDAYGELSTYILSELPNNYSQSNDEIGKCKIVDYDSYLKICKLTNEKAVSFYEYVRDVEKGNLDPNSFMYYENNFHNRDGVDEICKNIQSN